MGRKELEKPFKVLFMIILCIGLSTIEKVMVLSSAYGLLKIHEIRDSNINSDLSRHSQWSLMDGCRRSRNILWVVSVWVNFKF